MKSRKFSPRYFIFIGSMIALSTLFTGIIDEAKADDDSEVSLSRLGLAVESGEPVGLNLGPFGPVGTTGPLSSIKTARRLGSFRTEIVAGPSFIRLLEDALAAGFSVADAVRGTFDLGRRGTIEDLHEARLIVTGEDPIFGDFNIVLLAFAEGIIQIGTGRFADATGQTLLYLKFEVDPSTLDPSSMVPPVFTFRNGLFLFDFGPFQPDDDDD